MNDNFCPSHTVVELDTWERGPVFRHFIDDLRCVMSLTVDLEISRFLKRLSASGFRFYPAMIWAVSNVLNAHAEFRYAGTIRGDWSSGTGSSPTTPTSTRTGRPLRSW